MGAYACLHFGLHHGTGGAASRARGYREFNRNLAAHSALGSARTSRAYQGARPSLCALKDAIAKINVPTLIMTGDEDVPCLEPSLWLKRTITTYVLAVLPGRGHATNLEAPQLLADFLGQVEQGKDFVRPLETRPATIWGPGGDPRP